jgi:hypothetical protein
MRRASVEVRNRKIIEKPHHRLMEAMISGACVFSDVMWSIPPDYKDGESRVFYHSDDELKTKVLTI